MKPQCCSNSYEVDIQLSTACLGNAFHMKHCHFPMKKHSCYVLETNVCCKGRKERVRVHSEVYERVLIATNLSCLNYKGILIYFCLMHKHLALN